MEPPAHFPLLCKKALRVALSLHKKQPQADLARCRQNPLYCALKTPLTLTFNYHRAGLGTKEFVIVQLFFVSPSQQVCPQPDQAVPPKWRVRGGGPCAGGGVGLLRGGSVHHRGHSESCQSHTAIPWLPPPVPSNRAAACCIINPLSSTPCLPAVLEVSFLSMGFQPHFN